MRKTGSDAFRLEIVLSQIGIILTFAISVLVGFDLLSVAVLQYSETRWLALSGQLLFTFIIAMLIYGALVYQVTRLGYFRRWSSHVQATPEQLGKFWKEPVPKLTILVPSYMEEPDIVSKTLFSAALQDYPVRRVVLLIDDNPFPVELEDRERLARMRSLPQLIQKLLKPMACRMHEESEAFLARLQAGDFDWTAEFEQLAKLNLIAADWLLARAEQFSQTDHVTRFFREHILESRRVKLIEHACELQSKATNDLNASESSELQYEYRRLVTLFDTEVIGFERKKFENLSHEPNKAMNLNAFIGLMGRCFRKTIHGDKVYLESTHESESDLIIDDTDYLLTLDADSILMPDYSVRLINVAEQPGNERLAVVQTPYSAFPGAPGQLERIAGATTDIQYIVHQGFTHSDATYWVGANALIRKAALCDIATSHQERGHTVQVFIQDRTVIEDTESTVDLIARGWRLHNYPERLAYSATPPDFGALLIQRRRWANGGMLILPKLLRYLMGTIGLGGKWGEAFQRVHYLVSITAVNFGVFILMISPLTERVPSLWLTLTAVSYFILLGRDLSQCGYNVSDLARFYALTILLIPVNIGGVLKSLQQGITGKKIPFVRTPKIKDRTSTPVIYILAIYALIIQWILQFTADVESARWFHAVFLATNTLMLVYGLIIFIGFRASFSDVVLGIHLKLSKLVSRKPTNRLLPEATVRSD